ncbi:MAG: hypothetical protein IPK53_07460 [bacterium]|nr:hypothetical protein [bacterium]
MFNADGRGLAANLNKPITSLVGANLSGNPCVLAGTDSGTLVAYNPDGQRLWTRNLDLAANRAILNSTAPAAPPKMAIAALGHLSAPNRRNAPADVLLINQEGRTLEQYTAIDTTGVSAASRHQPRRQSEVPLARFATVELFRGSGRWLQQNRQRMELFAFCAPQCRVGFVI